MVGLEAYILGFNRMAEESFIHRCPECKRTKSVPMVYELGGWIYVDEDEVYCEDCNCQMDIEEED